MRSVTCLFTLLCALSAHSADPTANRPVSQGRPHDAALQTNLWISHLARYEAMHSGLTDEQRSILLQGRDLLAAGLLRRLGSPNAGEAADAHSALAEFKARASNAFSMEAYAEAFVRLGRSSSSRQSRVPGAAVPMVPYCDCNPGSGECGGECVTGSCRAMPDGCGIFGTDPCFGLCS